VSELADAIRGEGERDGGLRGRCLWRDVFSVIRHPVVVVIDEESMRASVVARQGHVNLIVAVNDKGGPGIVLPPGRGAPAERAREEEGRDVHGLGRLREDERQERREREAQDESQGGRERTPRAGRSARHRTALWRSCHSSGGLSSADL